MPYLVGAELDQAIEDYLVSLRTAGGVVKSSGHCFICLRKGHLAVNCRSGRRCYHCEGRHHGSICAQGEPMTHPQTRPSNSPPISTTSVNNNTSSTTHNTPVFLQTASVTIYNPDHPDVTMRVRLILDTGSQYSYPSDRVKNTLSLSATHTEALSIKTFGRTRGNVRTVM